MWFFFSLLCTFFFLLSLFLLLLVLACERPGSKWGLRHSAQNVPGHQQGLNFILPALPVGPNQGEERSRLPPSPPCSSVEETAEIQRPWRTVVSLSLSQRESGMERE